MNCYLKLNKLFTSLSCVTEATFHRSVAVVSVNIMLNGTKSHKFCFTESIKATATIYSVFSLVKFPREL